ncbi:hypothetical protein ACP70R_042664 [Stipagrostis hirtigluma subsp. patula]
MGGKGFLQSRSDTGSQFWKGLHSVKDHYEKGLEFRVRNGKKTRFWEDVWLNKCPLRVSFPKLFAICNQQLASVDDLWSLDGWKFSFRRAFGPAKVAEWNIFLNLLGEVELVEEDDEVIWALNKSGKYSTKSLYNLLTFHGVIDVRRKEPWQAKIPLKIKNFIWLLSHDRIQAAEQLVKKNWKGSVECKVCGEIESCDHIIFNCPVAKYLWSLFSSYLRASITPSSYKELVELVLGKAGCKRNAILLFIFGAMAWALWNTRNDRVFRDVLISSPDAVAHRSQSYMQRWTSLLKPDRRREVEELISNVKEVLKTEQSKRLDRTGVG